MTRSRRFWTTKRGCSIALPDHRALIVVYEPPFEELSLLALVRLAAVCWPSGSGHSPCRPNFPPLLSLSCFERYALSTFFVYTCTRAGAPSCHCAHLLCSSHIIGLRARRRQRVGPLPTLRASRSGRRCLQAGNACWGVCSYQAGLFSCRNGHLSTWVRNASFITEADFSGAGQATISWLVPEGALARPGRPGRPPADWCVDAWSALPGTKWIASMEPE
jgi:hypothetical protein